MLNEAIIRLKQWSVSLYLCLKKNLLNINPKDFEGLTPHIEKNKRKHRNDVYTKALEYALSDTQIKNIAVTGGFGAGKSSFLRSFEKHHKKWNYLFISLATFRELKNKDKNQLIERSILQQLFYKVRKKDIPSSRYERLQNFNFWEDSNPLLVIFLWLGSYLLLFKQDLTDIFLRSKNFDLTSFCDSPGLLCGISLRAVFIITTFFIGWKAYKYFSNFRITDLNLKGGLTVSTKSKDSLLNDQIDEILYFFEATKYDVVVIEDLDRSNNQEIFIKLREINKLINKSDQVKQTVNFVYAIKDEMFQDEETRTKFFDFMIPIIPHIHHSNSYSKLITKFPKHIKNEKFKNLLKIVSEYIYDMRLLINIVNEFKMYSEKVEFNDSSKLLAMIVYKNMYPSDFSKIHKNKGVLAAIFNSETAYKQIAMKDYNNKISIIKQELETFEKQKDWVSEITDLKSLYVFAAIEEYGNTTIYTDGVGLSLQLTPSNSVEHIFDKLKKAKNISINNQKGISFSDFETEVYSDATYEERVKNIEIINKVKSKGGEAKKEEVEELNNQKNTIGNYTLKELLEINDVNSEFFEKTKEIERGSELEDQTKQGKGNSISSKLFRLLIREGHIDKHFRTYISYFHNGEMTDQDNQFILDAREQVSIDFNYTLQNSKEVIENIDVRYFKHPSILNFNIFDKVLEKDEEIEPEKIESLFRLLKSNNNDTNKFIDQYFDYSPNKEEFIRLLIKNHTSFWEYIYNDSGYSKKKKDEYFAVIMRSSKVDEIVKLNKNETLEIYIESKEDFIEFCINEKLDENKIEQLLKKLSIKFPSLQFKEAENNFSQLIYSNNFYELSPSMLASIIECFSGAPLTPEIKEGLETSHYTTIKGMKSEGLEPLLKYINDDLEIYVRDVTLVLEMNTKESEETVIKLLNSKDVDEDLCNKIIIKEDIKIRDITSISYKLLWPLLLDSNSIAPSWDNILYFYKYEVEKKKKEEESSDE